MENGPTADLSQWVVEQMPGGTVKVSDGTLVIEDAAVARSGTAPRPLLAEHDLRGPEVLLTPNATYHIRLVARDGQAEFWRDGKRIFSFKDPEPLKSGWFGIRTVNSHLRISGFRVHSPADGKNGP